MLHVVPRSLTLRYATFNARAARARKSDEHLIRTLYFISMSWLYKGRIAHIYADCYPYPVYRDVAGGAILLTQTKQKIYQIEQNNSAQWHWLASFHRRRKTVTRSLDMLEARMKLFARYRINGDITDLTTHLRHPNPHSNQLSILK